LIANLLQKWLVITVRPTTSVKEKSTKEATAPQHIRFILPPIHPTKSSLRCVGGIFLFRETHLENFINRPNVIPTFCQRRCKTGAGTSLGANGDPIT